MADKSFGVKELNLFGSSGTPTIDSPNDLNLNASTVAISTNLTVGNKLSISVAGIVTAISGVVTYYGDGSKLTGISAGGFTPDAQENLFAGTGAGASKDSDTCFNIGIGKCALNAQDASGSYNDGSNVAIGCLAMCRATGGQEHVAIGEKAGAGLMNGYSNIYIGNTAGGDTGATINSEFNIGLGYGALRSNTGHCNISFGYEAGVQGNAAHNFTVGRYAGGHLQSSNNVAIGECAMQQTSTGNGNNIVIGKKAMLCSTSGSHNVILGCGAGEQTNTGAYNIFMGENAGKCRTASENNVFLGANAGRNGTSGCLTIAIGPSAGLTNTANNNIFQGNQAGRYTTTGSHNIFLGTYVAKCHTTGGCNIFIGNEAGSNAASSAGTGDGNIGLGCKSLTCLTSGSNSVVIGRHAGANVTSGSNYVAIGYEALKCEDTAGNGAIAIGYQALCLQNGSWGNNVAVGYMAGKSITDATENVALGYEAGEGITTGTGNVALGAKTLTAVGSGGSNVAIGQDTLRNNTGSGNVAVGGASLNASGAGGSNAVFGYGSGSAITSGSGNTLLGYQSGDNITSGAGNVVIGRAVDVASATGNTQFVIGCGSNFWICGDSNYKIYDKDGNEITGGGGGGGGSLSHWTESGNTSSPNGTVAANRFLATGSCTNIDAVIQPKGTGSFLAQLPDGTAAGGNKRGQYSVDLQLKRSNAGCVADEDYSVITGGENNYVDSCYATVGGGYGNCAGYMGSVNGGCNNRAGGNWGHVGGGHGNQASYAGVVAGGQSNNAGTYGSVLGGSSNSANGYGAVSVAAQGSSANGDRSTVMGNYACTRGRAGSIAIAAQCGVFSGSCKIQYSIINLGVDTTDANQTKLRSKSSAAGTDNQLTLPINSAYLFTGTVIANVTSGGNTHAWEVKGAIKRGGGNVSMIGSPSINNVAYDSGASAWQIVIGADTTNQALSVYVTGQSSTNIRWVATLNTTELAY